MESPFSSKASPKKIWRGKSYFVPDTSVTPGWLMEREVDGERLTKRSSMSQDPVETKKKGRKTSANKKKGRGGSGGRKIDDAALANQYLQSPTGNKSSLPSPRGSPRGTPRGTPRGGFPHSPMGRSPTMDFGQQGPERWAKARAMARFLGKVKLMGAEKQEEKDEEVKKTKQTALSLARALPSKREPNFMLENVIHARSEAFVDMESGKGSHMTRPRGDASILKSFKNSGFQSYSRSQLKQHGDVIQSVYEGDGSKKSLPKQGTWGLKGGNLTVVFPQADQRPALKLQTTIELNKEEAEKRRAKLLAALKGWGDGKHGKDGYAGKDGSGKDGHGRMKGIDGMSMFQAGFHGVKRPHTVSGRTVSGRPTTVSGRPQTLPQTAYHYINLKEEEVAMQMNLPIAEKPLRDSLSYPALQVTSDIRDPRESPRVRPINFSSPSRGRVVEEPVLDTTNRGTDGDNTVKSEIHALDIPEERIQQMGGFGRARLAQEVVNKQTLKQPLPVTESQSSPQLVPSPTNAMKVGSSESSSASLGMVADGKSPTGKVYRSSPCLALPLKPSNDGVLKPSGEVLKPANEILNVPIIPGLRPGKINKAKEFDVGMIPNKSKPAALPLKKGLETRGVPEGPDLKPRPQTANAVRGAVEGGPGALSKSLKFPNLDSKVNTYLLSKMQFFPQAAATQAAADAPARPLYVGKKGPANRMLPSVQSASYYGAFTLYEGLPGNAPVQHLSALQIQKKASQEAASAKHRERELEQLRKSFSRDGSSHVGKEFNEIGKIYFSGPPWWTFESDRMKRKLEVLVTVFSQKSFDILRYYQHSKTLEAILALLCGDLCNDLEVERIDEFIPITKAENLAKLEVKQKFLVMLVDFASRVALNAAKSDELRDLSIIATILQLSATSMSMHYAELELSKSETKDGATNSLVLLQKKVCVLVRKFGMQLAREVSMISSDVMEFLTAEDDSTTAIPSVPSKSCETIADFKNVQATDVLLVNIPPYWIARITRLVFELEKIQHNNRSYVPSGKQELFYFQLSEPVVVKLTRTMQYCIDESKKELFSEIATKKWAPRFEELFAKLDRRKVYFLEKSQLKAIIEKKISPAKDHESPLSPTVDAKSFPLGDSEALFGADPGLAKVSGASKKLQTPPGVPQIAKSVSKPWSSARICLNKLMALEPNDSLITYDEWAFFYLQEERTDDFTETQLHCEVEWLWKQRNG